jgi:hypothetical protein
VSRLPSFPARVWRFHIRGAADESRGAWRRVIQPVGGDSGALRRLPASTLLGGSVSWRRERCLRVSSVPYG